jgi:rhamnosyltransferase
MYQQVGDIVENTWINRNLGRLSHSKERYYYLTRNALTWGKIYKEDRKIYLSNLKGLFRIYINLIVFEKDKFDKIKYCIRGYKDYRRGILGKIPE